jgi:DNA-binding protein Fis
VVLSHGGSLTPELLAPPERSLKRWKPIRGRGSDLDGLIQQVVRAGVQSVAEEDGRLYERVVRGVERELLEQVMAISDGVVVKAAKRLGINRNTLQKKMSHKDSPEGVDEPAVPAPVSE